MECDQQMLGLFRRTSTHKTNKRHRGLSACRNWPRSYGSAEKSDELAPLIVAPEARTEDRINSHVPRKGKFRCPLWVTSRHLPAHVRSTPKSGHFDMSATGYPSLVMYTCSQETKRPRYAAGSRAGDQSCIYETFCVVCC